MKKIIYFSLIFVSSLNFNCKKEEAPPIGEPFSQVQGIQDLWILSKVEMVDEPTDPETAIDVSELMLGTTPSTILFNATSYMIDPGTSIHHIPFIGNWKFNDNQFPTELILTTNNEDINLQHLKPVREIVDKVLQYKYYRIGDACAGTFAGKPVISYIYTYNRK
ncbi:MAG: hypothetical protein IPG12_12145 [Saprospiraceae bacterium]|nr:hypothetical protein [Saprospiraceae bacterium]